MTKRKVVRDFGPRCVVVETIHPQLGRLERGRIYPQRTTGWQGVWQVVDVDHEQVGEPVVGDYLDAERVLLDATAELDETVPLSELIDQS